MPPTVSEITYAAHTASCTFLLDADGICRRIIPIESSRRGSSSSKREARSATRCVGAQYVASLDPSVTGMLADMPRIGAAMLFARVDERGRISLVRTGAVTHFERHEEEHPFDSERASGSNELPSHSVETSAPVLPPRSTSKVDDEIEKKDVDPYEDEDDDSARTRPIEALDPAALRGLRNRAFIAPAPPSSEPSPDSDDDDDDMLRRTAEYEARKPLESDDVTVPPTTLRKAAQLPAAPPYAGRVRLAPARRSEPQRIDHDLETTRAREPLRGTPRSRVDSEARTVPRTPRPSSPPPKAERIAAPGRRER